MSNISDNPILDDGEQVAKVSSPILVVDDDLGVRNFLKNILEAMNYNVIVAEGANEAIELTKTKLPSLVIADVHMPEKSGVQLLNELKADDPTLPVIIMTGQPNIEAAVNCIKMGASDYIKKPFDTERLEKLVNTTLEIAKLQERQKLATSTTGIHQRILAGYKIVRTIGEGSMGIVFRAEAVDAEMKPQLCALKILKHKGLNESELREALERFIHEAEAAASIKHDNVVNIINYGLAEEEQIPYIMMELLEGRSLKKLIDVDHPYSYKEKAQIILQAADALVAIHSHGILHRDIKPDNIIIDSDLNVKITDFGIARLPNSHLTPTPKIMGAPVYLSPEGFTKQKKDNRSDIFALGTVSYEFLVGRRPFIADNVAQYAVVIRQDRPPEPRKIKPDFPQHLQRIIARMIRKLPEERYGSAKELADDLSEYIHDTSPRTTFLGHMTEALFTRSDWS